MHFGYIKLYRQIQETFLWSDNYNELQAWMFILMSANFQKTQKMKFGKIYILERGQAELSIRFLMKKFNWSEKKVSNFLKILEKEGMIKRILLDKKFSILEVVNYSKYQDTDFIRNNNGSDDFSYKKRDTEGDTEGDTERDTEGDKVNKYNKNDKNEKNKNTISFSENEKEDTDNSIKQIIDYLNSRNNSSYRYNSKKTVSLIKARLKEGFIVDDFKTVIDNKVDEWSNDNKMSKFLRPVTLFAEKFESYLNEKKFGNKKPENNDDKFYLIEQIIAEGKYRSESQLHLLPEREASFIESLPCGFVTVNELSGNEFEYNKLKKQYREFIKE